MTSGGQSYEIKNNEFAIKELIKLLSMTGVFSSKSPDRYSALRDAILFGCGVTFGIANITVFESYILFKYRCDLKSCWCHFKDCWYQLGSARFSGHEFWFYLKEMEIRNLILDDKWSSTIMD